MNRRLIQITGMTILALASVVHAQSNTAPAATRPSEAAITSPTTLPSGIAGAMDDSQELARISAALSDRDISANDRCDLLMQKCDVLLHLKQRTPALGAIGEAVRSGADKERLAAARGIQLLVSRSPDLTYTPEALRQPTQPKTGDDADAPTTRPAPVSRSPISIVDPVSRKLALRALFKDEMSTRRDALEQAQQAATLPPILAAAGKLQPLLDLQQALQSTDARLAALTKGLAGRARELMDTALKDMDRRVDEIHPVSSRGAPPPRETRDHGIVIPDRMPSSLEGNRTQDGPSPPPSSPAPPTLSGQDAAALREMVSTCKRTVLACDQLQLQLSSTGVDFAAPRTLAGSVTTRAQKLLTQYGR